MKIKCASSDCKYNSATCSCTYKGTIKLTDCYYHTIHEGYQHFHRCKMYEKDESIEQMEKEIVDFFKERMNEDVRRDKG